MATTVGIQGSQMANRDTSESVVHGQLVQVGVQGSRTANSDTAHVSARAVLGWLWLGMLVVRVLLHLHYEQVAGLVMGCVFAILPVPVFIGLTFWLDRMEAEPPKLVLRTFVSGAIGAFMLSIVFEYFAGKAVADLFVNPATVRLFRLSVLAPVVEETMKGLILVRLFRANREDFENIMDGVVYAAMAGLGFAMTENIFYYGGAWIHGGGQRLLATFAVRGLLSPYSHPLFTAMTGIGFGIAAQTSRQWLKAAAPCCGFAAAVFLHGLWNLAASLHHFVQVYFLFMVPLFVLVLVLIRFSLRQEERLLRQQLEPELRSGRLTQGEYEEACSGSARLRCAWRCAWRWVVSGNGEEWRRRRKLQVLARELGFHRSRETEMKVEHYAKYIQMMETCRGPQPLPTPPASE
jgi:RsiW-degrading membrane proteinase PrsW (M82 family)